MTTAIPDKSVGFKGNEKLLWGIVLGVVTFWLFAGTVGTIAPNVMNDINGADGNFVDAASMNFAVSITALFSGLFIVFMGGLADRIGRVKITLLGLILGVVGSLLLIFAAGPAALPLLLVGRAIQGLSAACIMPATMALVKTYWDGKDRQRAVSMWSIGSWGGSGLAAIFGGAVVQFTSFGWRGIFMASIVISVISFLMIIGTPESKVEQKGEKKPFDVLGLILFIVGTLGLMIVLLFGSRLGWLSPTIIILAIVAIVAYVAFVMWEKKQANPFIDFGLFKNTTFTGATISNFLVNATIGLMMVSQQLIQIAGFKADGTNYTPWDAGLLTLGYAVFIIAFIRIGEKLLQRFGPRKPMIWANLIVIASCVLLMLTHLLIGEYVILAIIAYSLFGLGLAFYATPSTDAALSNLPADQAGSGSGIYKMASSLGGAIGAAISLAVFTGLSQADAQAIGNVIDWTGRTDNVAIRLAGMVAIGVNMLFAVLAILSIVMTVPKGGGSRDKGKVEATADPKPQLTPDEESKTQVLEQLRELPVDELQRLAQQALGKK